MTGNDRWPQIPVGTAMLTAAAVSLLIEAGANERYKWDEAGLDPKTKRPIAVNRSHFLTQKEIGEIHRVTVPLEDSNSRYKGMAGSKTPYMGGTTPWRTPSRFYCGVAPETPRVGE